MVEAAVFADDDDDVLDWRGCVDRVDDLPGSAGSHDEKFASTAMDAPTNWLIFRVEIASCYVSSLDG